MTIYSILAVLGAAIFFISTLIFIPLLLILDKVDPKKSDQIAYPLVCWGFRMIRKGAGVKVTVIGRENLPQNRACLLAANHRSIFDIILGTIELPRPFRIISKKELEKIPLLHFWMKHIHCYFLDRNSIRSGVDMVRDSSELMKKGYSVFIFPEGTRSKQEGKFGEFKGGSFKIATRVGAPIVPMTFIKTGDILEDHPWKVHNRQIRIIFGEPIETKGMSMEERSTLHEKVQKIIEDTYKAYDFES